MEAETDIAYRNGKCKKDMVDRMIKNLHFPEDIKNKAGKLYNEYFKGDSIRSKNRAGALSACIYEAFHSSGFIVDAKDICDALEVDLKCASKYLKILRNKCNRSRPTFVTAETVVKMYVDKLDLDMYIDLNEANMLIKRLMEESDYARNTKVRNVAIAVIMHMMTDNKSKVVSLESMDKKTGVQKVLEEIKKIESYN